MDLSLFPTEILLEILKYCQIKDLSKIKQTCQRFNEITNLEDFWSFRCIKDYNVSLKGRHFKTFKEFYSLFLHKYGHLIGTYKYKFFNNGGLIEIDYDDSLNVWLYKLVRSANDKSLVKCLMFKIEKDPQESKVNILCCLGTDTPHNGFVKKSLQGRRYIFQCKEKNKEAINDFHENLREFSVENYIYKDLLRGGVELFPVYIQDASDIPKTLLLENEEFPSNLVKPGLYRIVHWFRGDHMIFLNYTENFKIDGFYVSTGERINHALKVNLKKSGSAFDLEMIVDDFELNLHHTLSDLPKSHINIFSKSCKHWYKCFSKFMDTERFTESYFVVYDPDHFLVFESTLRVSYFERISQSFNKKRGFCIYDNQ